MQRPEIEGPGGDQLDVAAENADLGLPIPKGTRGRTLKRLLARIGWTFGRPQVTYNHAVVEALAQLSHVVTVTRTETAASVANQLGEYQRALTDLRLRTGELAALVELREAHIADLQDRIAQVAARDTVAAIRSSSDRDDPPLDRTAADQPLDDALMISLEDRFRPPVQRRASADEYLLTVIDAAGADGVVLDIGCGTGDWIRALVDSNVVARGIDTNPVAIAACTAAGLDVEREDAVGYLKRQDEGSIAVITAFHVVEHLVPAALVDLLDLALRALRPGGLLILETPNPMNLRVGAATFWLDPTHVRPIPPALLTFIAQQRGFAGVEVRFLHPASTDDLGWSALDDTTRAALEPVASRLLELLSGPQDYALLARRPGERAAG